MKISWFSIFMAIITSSLMMLIVFLFRKRMNSIAKVGIPTFIIMLGFCFFRMVFFVEFPRHQYIIEDPYVLAHVLSPFLRDNFKISTKIMLITWIVVFAILLLQLLISQYKVQKKICSLKNTADEKIYDKLVEIDKEYKLSVLRSDIIPTPMLIGVKNPMILLPELEYTEQELDVIIRHEYTHWKNKDNLIKLFIQIFWRMFWWNPFSYLFLINLSKILELKCDREVTINMTNTEKFDYLQAMLDIIKKTNLSRKCHYRVVTSCYVKENNKFDINQRFEYVLSKPTFKRSQCFLRTFVIVLMVTIICASYYFIFQPQYEPLYIDISTDEISRISAKKSADTSTDISDDVSCNVGDDGDDNTYELDSSQGYIVKKGKNYKVVLSDGSSYEVEDEESIKQMTNAGFKLMMEE